MAKFALLFGVLLIAVGCIGYFQPSIFGEGKPQESMTGLIPAWFGAALALCGIIALLAENARKHVMHFAAMVGLFGAIGGFVPLIRAGFNFSKASNVAGVLMTALCAIFVVLCVKSFIDARKARQRQE